MAQQHDTQQRTVQQVEGSGGQRPDPHHPLGQRKLLPLGLPDPRHGGQDTLSHLAVFAGQKLRAQRGVPLHQSVHGTVQRLDIQRTTNIEQPLDDVGGTGRIQLPEEPLAQLCRRQRLRLQTLRLCQLGESCRQ